MNNSERGISRAFSALWGGVMLAGMEAAGGGESVYARFARRRIEVLEKEVGND